MEIEEAVEKAIEFLERKGGHYIHRLVSVKIEEDVWKLEFDIGTFTKELVELEIANETGRVLKYEEPR
jgi:hypothetical protein